MGRRFAAPAGSRRGVRRSARLWGPTSNVHARARAGRPVGRILAAERPESGPRPPEGAPATPAPSPPRCRCSRSGERPAPTAQPETGDRGAAVAAGARSLPSSMPLFAPPQAFGLRPFEARRGKRGAAVAPPSSEVWSEASAPPEGAPPTPAPSPPRCRRSRRRERRTPQQHETPGRCRALAFRGGDVCRCGTALNMWPTRRGGSTRRRNAVRRAAFPGVDPDSRSAFEREHCAGF